MSGAVLWLRPPSWKLNAAVPRRRRVKGAFMPEIPATGARMRNDYDDSVRNAVGRLESARCIPLTC